MEAFVYCWTDHKLEKLYIGWHKGQPNDGYICSSKIMLQEYNNRPNDFTRQIIATGSPEDMSNFETTLLKNFNVVKDQSFYNMHNGNGFYHLKKHTEETKEKLKKPKTLEHRKNLSINHCDISGDKNPMYGRSIVKEKNLKWYNNTIKEIYVTEGMQPSNFIEGRIKNVSKSTFKCPHCEKIGGGGAMKRWHFDNCKDKK